MSTKLPEVLAELDQLVGPWPLDPEDWDNFWNIDIDKEGCSYFRTPPNFSGVCCTGYALELFNRYPKDIKIYGFYAEDNPGTVFQTQRVADGHDFAVYQDRYIIDPWAYGVEFIMTSLILDLWDNRLNDQVKHIYGHRDKWERMHGTERYYVLHQPERQT